MRLDIARLCCLVALLIALAPSPSRGNRPPAGSRRDREDGAALAGSIVDSFVKAATRIPVANAIYRSNVDFGDLARRVAVSRAGGVLGASAIGFAANGLLQYALTGQVDWKAQAVSTLGGLIGSAIIPGPVGMLMGSLAAGLLYQSLKDRLTTYPPQQAANGLLGVSYAGIASGSPRSAGCTR